MTMLLPQQNMHGVKRRRSYAKEIEEDKEAKLRRKLHHSLRELRKAVKRARTFEVQKTLKKLKEARYKDPGSDVTKDLEAQLMVLKHLSYDRLALSAFMTKLKKDKILSADPSIQTISAELVLSPLSPGAPDIPMVKAQSRILSSKVLALEVMSVVESLRTFLHPSAESEDVREVVDIPRPSPGLPKRRRTGTGREQDASLSRNDVANPSGEGNLDGVHENTSGDEPIADVDDSWGSGSVAGPPDDYDSCSDDFNEDDYPSENPRSRRSQLYKTKGQSEFLPSLSVGFVRGDSGSDLSDGETRLGDGIKKNRRGQRARRAIWEKKFGKNANHIKKRQQRKIVRGPEHYRPDSVRVDVNVDRRSGKGSSLSRPHHTQAESRALGYTHKQVRRPTLGGTEDVSPTKRQSEPFGPKAKTGERPLHPSWVAKKKQQMASTVPSQGTKIVFCES